jgi:hypothetical protein
MKFDFLKILKYLCPLLSIVIPIMAILGAFISPPSWAEDTLRKYDYSSKILVAFSSKFTSSAENETHKESRSYVLLPSLNTVKISMYSRNNENMTVTSEDSKFTSYEALFTYILCLFGTWWYWIRPASRQQGCER